MSSLFNSGGTPTKQQQTGPQFDGGSVLSRLLGNMGVQGGGSDIIARLLQATGQAARPPAMPAGVPLGGGGLPGGPGLPGTGLTPGRPMGIGLPNVGGPTGGTSVNDVNTRPPDGAPWWNTTNPYGNAHKTIDPNSSLPVWQQLGFYDKNSWDQRGKPMESGMLMPSLTDPKTGIYHYELYTPEYEKAALAATQGNDLWRPPTYPGSGISLSDPRELANIAEWKANGGSFGPSISGNGGPRPIPWWMTGGSGVNPAGGSGSAPDFGPTRWQNAGYGSKDEWRAAGKLAAPQI